MWCLVCVLNEILSKQQHFKFDKIGVHRRTQFQRSHQALSKSVSCFFSVVAVRNIRLTTVQYHSVHTFFGSSETCRTHTHREGHTHTINSPTIEEFCAPYKPITTFTIIRILSKKEKCEHTKKTILCVDSLTLEQSIYSIQTWWNQSSKIHFLLLLSDELRVHQQSWSVLNSINKIIRVDILMCSWVFNELINKLKFFSCSYWNTRK